ncbi:MAG: TRAP transporter small permease [Lautropia sp.]
MKLLETVRTAVRWLCLALLALLIVTPIVQVVMRGVFTLPFSGAEELARYFLVCLTFVGASWVTRTGGQIRMEELQAVLPPRLRWLLQMAIELSGVAVFVVFLVASVVTILNNLDNETATLQMPFWLFMAPLAVGSLLMIVETFVKFLATFTRGRADAKQTTLS